MLSRVAEVVCAAVPWIGAGFRLLTVAVIIVAIRLQRVFVIHEDSSPSWKTVAVGSAFLASETELTFEPVRNPIGIGVEEWIDFRSHSAGSGR